MPQPTGTEGLVNRMANSKRCKECIYRATVFWHTCDYALLTGETRTKRDKPLKKGQCSHFIKGYRLTTPKEPILPQRVKYNWAAARELYSSGATDREIALLIVCPKHAVGDWRRRNGLPPNKKKQQKDGD